MGGYLADRIGGILTLTVVLLFTIGGLLVMSIQPSLVVTTLLFMFCFAALGAGNGALFQLVPLRWPKNTAIAGGMIGEIGALGGAILRNAMGLSKQYTGSFGMGFIFFAALAGVVLIVLQFVQRSWTKSWIEKHGKAPAEPAETRATLAA